MAAVACLALAAFTTTWGGLRFLPAGQIGDVFLMLSLGLIFLLIVFGDLRFSTPFWVWIAPIAVILCLAIRWLAPIPYSHIIMRYTEPPYEPNNFPKAAFWLAALILVPLAIIACTKLYERTPQLVMGAFTAGVCVSSAVGVSDLMGWTEIAIRFGSGGEATRQTGLTVHPVMLGFTCVLAIPFALYFLYFHRFKWIWGIALVLLFGGVLASGSRGAQVGALLFCALSVLFAPRQKVSFRQALLTVVMSGVVVLLVAQLFMGDVLSQLVRFGGGIDAGGSDNQRTRLAQQALDDFQNFPIAGLGLKSIVNAHSIYLQCLQAGGAILLIGMLIYWLWCLRDAWVLARRGYVVARYLFLSISAWLVLGIIENQLTDRLLYFSIGCVAAMSTLYLQARNHGPDPVSQDVNDATTAQLQDSRR
ncbi:O-antigen ligase family protein [Mycolicibacterium sp. XJ1819]